MAIGDMIKQQDIRDSWLSFVAITESLASTEKQVKIMASNLSGDDDFNAMASDEEKSKVYAIIAKYK